MTYRYKLTSITGAVITREGRKNQNKFPRRLGQNKSARGKEQEGASQDGNVNLKYDNQ